MKTVILTELKAPRDPKKLERYLKYLKEEQSPYLENLSKTDIKYSMSVWNDNSGVTLIWIEFETVEDFSQVWEDMDFQRLMSHRALLVECKMRILRPGIRD
jgi:hypothetical protein